MHPNNLVSEIRIQILQGNGKKALWGWLVALFIDLCEIGLVKQFGCP